MSDDEQKLNLFLDLHQKEREVGFANEAFAITILQAVSVGVIAAAFTQTDTLTKLAGKIPVAVLLTLSGAAVLCTVLAAYWSRPRLFPVFFDSGLHSKFESQHRFYVPQAETVGVTPVEGERRQVRVDKNPNVSASRCCRFKWERHPLPRQVLAFSRYPRI